MTHIYSMQIVQITQMLFSLFTRLSVIPFRQAAILLFKAKRQTCYFSLKHNGKYRSSPCSPATKEMDVDIAVSSVYGTPIKTYSKQKVETGNNKIAISALLDQRDLASIVTVSHKDERHSKTITVGSHE
ncbi:MAG: hypothetical protein IJY03_06540 [Prevotella sp.]|nr:hypothetical protein [Prevotella sp.]